MLYRVFKTTPNFAIDETSIKISGLFIKGKEIKENDITEINLFAAGNVIQWVTIVTKIELATGERIRLTDPYYRNTGELKQALLKFYPNKIKSYKKEGPPTLSTGNDEQKFSGSPIFNLNTLMFGGLMVLIFLLPFFQNRHKDSWVVILFVLPMFYFVLSHQSYYFIIDKKFVTIRNHFFFWVRIRFSLEDIVAANFEHPGKLSKSLRITTKDFKSRYYSAGSLSEKDWKVLKDKIDELGIYFIP